MYFFFILIYSLYWLSSVYWTRRLKKSTKFFLKKKSEELMFNNIQVYSMFFLFFIFNWFIFHECVSSLLSWNSKPNFYFILQIRDVSDAKISRSADADAYANICAWRSAEADAHANIKGWRSTDANADANIRATRSADANICNIIIIYHDFLSTPRRGSHSHV